MLLRYNTNTYINYSSESSLLYPKSVHRYIFLFILACCCLILIQPTLAADKVETDPPQQQETTNPTQDENPFIKKPKEDKWTQSEPKTEKTDDPSTDQDIDPEIPIRRQILIPYLESLKRWKYPPNLGDLSELYDWKPRPKTETKGIDLPMDSNLRITGYQSVTVELNKTHYFGEGDLNRYGGYNYGSYGDYGSGLDLGLSSSYGYDDFGYSSGFGSGYGSFGSSYGSGYSSYGGVPRATGINIRQQQKIGLHGRVGERTHIEVDYNAGDTYGGGYGGSSSFGGYGLGGAKEQKIKVWYEGKPDSFIKTISFGDITLSLPNTRFLNINRNLFGLEGVFEYKNTRMTLFGSRSRGIREVRTFRGQSRRASFGYGPRGIQIADSNYIKNRFYLVHKGEDDLIHEAYLPIKAGSVEIYIDDSVVGNNQGGILTSQGYFNPQFPGQDYNIDYQTGEIEFLSPISTSYTIIVAYEYLGDGGGTVGNPGNVFVDDNNDGTIDEEGEEIGYVVLKAKGFRGTAASHVYSLGNRNINPRDFQLTIIRQGESETYETENGPVPYIEIFGLDQNRDGLIDPDFIDYDRGLLRFPDLNPFQLNDPQHPYYQYRDDLNNEDIYLESLRSTDQIYTIVADYAYQSETYNVGLFVIPNSETVRLNGRLLTRDTDYMMIYEVGTIRFFTELDEFDEIVVEFEKTPFGGGTQQSVVGVWLDYTHKPKPKSEKEQNLEDRFNRLGGFQTSQTGFDNTLNTDAFAERFPNTGTRARSGLGNFGMGSTGIGGSGFGGSGYSSYGGFGGRSRVGTSYYGGYGAGTTYFNPVYQKGFNISTGYILTTGQQPTQIPNANELPNRLQAFNINTSFGREFNIAWLVNPLPFVNLHRLPLSIDFSGESAYSHNNPNSVGVALIDSMEGVKQTTTIPTIKYSWKPSSIPYVSEAQQSNSSTHIYPVLPTQENRVLFKVALKDKEESEAVGNYMRNRDVPASSIQPLSLSTEERLIMEIGYDFNDIIEEWGGFANGVSKSGVDYSERGFIEMWLRVQGDDDVTLYLNIGAVNEDTDADARLDSEDLPPLLEDTNGDGIIDALDLDLENIPNTDRGNGRLDKGEDEGWRYDGPFQNEDFGAGNQVLDSEDLNGDGVLDNVDAYFQVAIPLNDIPNEWIKGKNSNGWTFLNIPLTEFIPEGSRVPSLVFVQHFRLWLMKNRPGNVKGTFQWASIEIVGNRWEQGVVTKPISETTTYLANSQVVQDTIEKFIVGTKDNFSYDDYQSAYLEIEDNELFRKLHPFTSSSLGFQTQQQREQTLSLEYYLFPGSHGVTSKQLKGFTQSEGQDFSTHDTLRLWLYGDKSDTTFVLQLAPNVRTGYRSSFYSTDPFLNQPTQEDDVNIFENLTNYYEYTVTVDFEGWKLIEIDLRDNKRNEYPDQIEDQNADTDSTLSSQSSPIENAPDGHPDGFTVRGTGSSSSQLSVKNIGGILLGIRNDTNREISGEIWVNEIHLGDPLIRAGWARRGNMSVSLGRIVRLRGGYASQDKDFESGAGEIGRQRLSSRGYSTTNNDYNINADVTILSWLPIRYAIREQESETEALRGSYSSFISGRSETHNRDVSVQFNKNPFPNLGFAYNYQDFWNERQGTQVSHLYTGTLRYTIGSKFGFNFQYRHEDIIAQPETATDTSSSSTSFYSYGYGRNRDEKTDSGSISLNISPINAFSLNPSYDIRRTLERRNTNQFTNSSIINNFSNPIPSVEDDTDEDILPNFTLAEREHRVSLTPRLNRDLFGLRPTVTSRISFRENYFTSQKDASLNGNISLGLNLRIQKWFGWIFTEKEEVMPAESTNNATTKKPTLHKQQLEKLREMGIDETEIQKRTEEQSNWINRDKAEMDQKQITNAIAQGQNTPQQPKQEGFLQRTINTFTISTSANFNASEFFRRLESGQSLLDIWELDPDAEERSNSNRSSRYGIRTSMDPLKWISFGTNVSFSDSFRKSYATTYTSQAESYEADIKLNSQQASSFQLRYSLTIRQNSNLDVTLSDSTAHTPSVSWLHKWSDETRTSLGIRTTLRDHLRSGIESDALIITPNFSIDYRYHTEGGIRVPFFGKIPLKHDLDLTNTFSLAIRRENYGINKEERSERYETTLRVGYKLSQHLTANLHLGLSYNHDRVEEGRDYLSIASALTVRGEFQ